MSRFETRLRKLEEARGPASLGPIRLFGVTAEDEERHGSADAAIEAKQAELVATGKASANDFFVALVGLKASPDHPALMEARRRMH